MQVKWLQKNPAINNSPWGKVALLFIDENSNPLQWLTLYTGESKMRVKGRSNKSYVLSMQSRNKGKPRLFDVKYRLKKSSLTS